MVDVAQDAGNSAAIPVLRDVSRREVREKSEGQLGYMTNIKTIPLPGEHERLLRLVRKLRRQLVKLPRHGGIDEAADSPDAPVRDEIERIDRFLRWREKAFKRRKDNNAK